MGQTEKELHGRDTAGQPPTAEMLNGGQHRRSVPEADLGNWQDLRLCIRSEHSSLDEALVRKTLEAE
jgi:hypothetical protein